jgi:WD40 repeat protein
VTAEHLRRVEQIFAEVIGQQTGSATTIVVDKIATRLEQLCAGDAKLRRDVESLLKHHLDAEGSDGKFLDPNELRQRRALGADALLDEFAGTGTRVGGYTIIGRLGSGGMGVVYAAEQQRPRRIVALKLIRSVSASRSMLRRFEREAELLGRLSHPGIAQIFESGVAEIDGRPSQPIPYMAMEFVQGPNIIEYVHTVRPSVRQRLEIIASICDAVQHAHQRGVIHRDLKPQNILLASASSANAPPQPKVLDFGVARVLDNSLGEAHTELTSDGQIVGTLAYMSPEQIQGAARDVDTRTDVYSLGALLYHLLAGRPAIEPGHRSIAEMVQAVLREEPQPLGSIDRSLRGEIEAIVHKAIAKDRTRRYQSAAQLGDDLRRYLSGQPIGARQDSALYLLRKRIERYRAVGAAGFLVLLALVSFAIYAQMQRHRANVEADRSAIELSNSRVEQGRLLAMSGDFRTAEDVIWNEYLRRPDSIRSHWALWELYSRFPCLRTILAPNDARVRCAVWRGDGKVIAVGSDAGTILLWDPSDGKLLRSIPVPHKMVETISFIGKSNLIASAGDDGSIAISDSSSGQIVRTMRRHQGMIWNIDVSRDGRLLASAGNDGLVIVWDVVSGNELVSHQFSAPARSACLDASGARLAACCDDGELLLWPRVESMKDGHPIRFAGHDGAVSAVTFNPAGSVLASGGADGTLRLWNPSTGELIKSIDCANGNVRDIQFSGDGKLISADGWWRVDILNAQDLTRARPAGAEPAAGYAAFRARFSPDGSALAMACPFGAVRIWSMESSGGVEILHGHAGKTTSVAAARDREGQVLIASTAEDGRVNVWARSVDGGWSRRHQIESGLKLQKVELSRDGAVVAASGEDGSINIWDCKTGQRIAALTGHRDRVLSLAFTHDGKRLISGSRDRTLRVCERAADGSWWLQKSIDGLPHEPLAIALSDDDQLLATAHRGTLVEFWSLPKLELRGVRPATDAIWAMAFAHHHPVLATAGWDRTVELWDVSNLRQRAPNTAPSTDTAPRCALLRGHTQLVRGASFSADDSLLASASSDGLLKIWDASKVNSSQAQSSLVTLDAHAGEASEVVFLPEPLNRMVAAGYQDGSVRVWDLGYFDRHIAGQTDYQTAIRGQARAAESQPR